MDTVTSLLKALDIVSILSGKEQGATLPELVEAMNLPRSTITRVLNTLVQYGLVEKDGRAYRCGRTFDDWAQRDRHAFLKRKYRPMLEEIAEKTGELTLLGLHEGNGIIHLDYVECDHQIRVAPAPLTRHNLKVNALGKLALSKRADLSDKIDDPVLLSEIEEIRRTGVAWNREESVSGMIAMATHGFSASITEPMLAVAWPTYRFTEEKAEEALKHIARIKEGFRS